jgi:hypothetical protein
VTADHDTATGALVFTPWPPTPWRSGEGPHLYFKPSRRPEAYICVARDFTPESMISPAQAHAVEHFEAAGVHHDTPDRHTTVCHPGNSAITTPRAAVDGGRSVAGNRYRGAAAAVSCHQRDPGGDCGDGSGCQDGDPDPAEDDAGGGQAGAFLAAA